MNILDLPQIMTDIETLSKRQNSTIVSVGAVKFTLRNGITDTFLINVDPQSCIQYGLHIDQDTVSWWEKQPNEVSNLWKVDPQPLDYALSEYNKFVGKVEKQYLWAQGSVFDFGILRSAFDACGIQQNWKYYFEMDSRTIFSLLGIRNDKLRKSQTDFHSALGDAKAQALTLIGALKANPTLIHQSSINSVPLHLCSLNWSPWSSSVQGYDAKRQYRYCLKCNKMSSRDACGSDQQVKAVTANAAVESIVNGIGEKNV